MPLLVCPNCSILADDDALYCERCGHDLVSAVGALAMFAPARHHDVVVDRVRVNCVCHGERLRHDPLSDSMTSIFCCSRYPERIDCVGCRVCTTCGELRCTCGFLSISIGVKVKGTVIDTVPLRPRLV